MSTYDGLNVAHVALKEAGPRGLPVKALITIVAHVGQVSEGSAYQALRAVISRDTQYRAERRTRWVARVQVDGRALDRQVWRMLPAGQVREAS